MHSNPSMRQLFTPARRRLQVAVVLVTLGVAGYALYGSRACCAPAPVNLDEWIAREARDTAALAPDLAVEIETGTGSLAPRYHYDYRLRVERSGAATLTYWPGYGQDDSQAVRARFTLADTEVRTIASLARQLQDSPGPIDDRDIPNGGRSARITLVAAGRRSIIEEWQREPFDRWQRALQERSRRVIPDSVWAQCEDAQRRHAERETP